MWDTKFVLDLVDAVYQASALGNRPRPIDRYIDYFGDATADGNPEGPAPDAGSVRPYRRAPGDDV
jgi:hypothetical protein